MRVFIMWSGERSRRVAEELHRFLDGVARGPQYFISTEDIETGVVWENIISGQLETTHFGVACLTGDNLSSPWIHFEAGAISKVSGNSVVVPYLIDVEPSDLTGPLTKFQAVRADEGGTRSLVRALNTSLPVLEQSRGETIETVFDALWPQLASAIQGAQTAFPRDAKDLRSQDDILRELLDRLRNLERKMTPAPSSAQPQASAGLSTAHGEAWAEGRIVLWVDDRPRGNLHVINALERAGAWVILAESTDEAHSRLTGLGSKGPDVVITDMTRGSSRLAGLYLLQDLESLGLPAHRIVYSTSREAEEQEAQLRELGAGPAITGADSLLARLRELFAERPA
jgi:hypothetical protein